MPESTARVWEKVQKNRVKSLASRAGKELDKVGDPTKRHKDKQVKQGQSSTDYGEAKQASGGPARQNTGAGRGCGKG